MEGLFAILDSIPENLIAIMVYLGGSAIILWCWYLIAKRLPKSLGGITWILVFAVLLTPTVSEGTNAELAPATFGLIFGVLTKENALVWSNLANILMVIGIGLLLGYVWSKYYMAQPNEEKESSPL